MLCIVNLSTTLPECAKAIEKFRHFGGLGFYTKFSFSNEDAITELALIVLLIHGICV